MPEKEQEQTPQAEPIPKAKAGGKSHLAPIAGGLIVFVVFVVIFSLKFGVFSSTNVKPSAQSTEPAATASDSVAQEPDDSEESTGASAYDELFDGFDGSSAETQVTDSAMVRDSLQKVQWYEEQRQEIDRKVAQLNVERKQLEQLKAQVEALLDRKKAAEEGNITQMAKLYEGMETSALVPILANLEDAQVSILISKMKKQKASEVLGQLPPERAARITQYLISMNN